MLSINLSQGDIFHTQAKNTIFSQIFNLVETLQKKQLKLFSQRQ